MHYYFGGIGLNFWGVPILPKSPSAILRRCVRVSQHLARSTIRYSIIHVNRIFVSVTHYDVISVVLSSILRNEPSGY